jgi:hypothetical protein
VTLPEKIEEVLRLEAMATPGPWEAYGIGHIKAPTNEDPYQNPCDCKHVSEKPEDDAAFIAAARNIVRQMAAAYTAALTALEASDSDRRKLREELKCSHDTLCKIGGAVRFFFPDIPIAGDTVANIEAEAVKVKARLAKLEAVRPHLATVLEHAERCRLGPQEIAAFKAALAD